MAKIVGIGQVHTSPPAAQASEVSPLPLLIKTPGSSKLTMRASPLGPMPMPSAQPAGASCWPLRSMCFTSQYTKDEAQRMCRSGIKPEKIPGRGCPAGASRIDTYGSYSESSASQFDPCLIQDFPVCSGGSRFGRSRVQVNQEREGGGIFGLGMTTQHTRNWLAIVGGIGIGFVVGKYVLRL